MTTRLHFKPSFSATAIYLARLSARGEATIDEGLVGGLRPCAEALAAEFSRLGLDGDIAWPAMLSAAAQWDSNRELAEAFLRKVQPAAASRAEVVSRLSAAIAGLEAELRGAAPELEKELALRVGPLREQWEARGPGLMRRLAKMTDPDLPPPEATVCIVWPARGGGGWASIATNRVIFEGVLTNADALLPEVVRLAWLTAQLQLDLAKFSEAISPARLATLAPLALLPPIFEAAGYVELIGSAPAALEHALRAWISPGLAASVTAETLTAWWEAQVDQQVPWRIALGGLDRLLSE